MRVRRMPLSRCLRLVAGVACTAASKAAVTSTFAVAVTGCAASLSSFQPAHVGPRRTARAEAGYDVSIPTGTIASTIDAAKTLAGAAESRALSDDEKIQLFSAGLNLALNPPAFDYHYGFSINPADNWEIALRYAGGAPRIAGRHQLLMQEIHGVDLSVGLGVSRYLYRFPIERIVYVLRIDDFSRWNFDLPISFGWHNDFFRAWGGPRLALTTYATDIILHVPANAASGMARDESAHASGSGFFSGLQVGGAAGYRWLFVALELTIVRLSGSARLDVLGRTTNADTGSWILYPGAGLMGEF